MANIVDVFFEIMAIAREKIPEIERQSQAAKRIDQFKADIASLRMRKGVTEGIYERLRDKLRAAAGNPDVPKDERNVFMRAFSQLTSGKG
jgi:predicted RNA-binding Zn ribbon-like protein